MKWDLHVHYHSVASLLVSHVEESTAGWCIIYMSRHKSLWIGNFKSLVSLTIPARRNAFLDISKNNKLTWSICCEEFLSSVPTNMLMMTFLPNWKFKSAMDFSAFHLEPKVVKMYSQCWIKITPTPPFPIWKL